jgi:hypothetical protein
MAKGRFAGSLSKRVRGARGTVKVISSKAFSAVGRPSPRVWTTHSETAPMGKMSVRRLIRRDPARGRTLPLADKITDTHIDLQGQQNPTVVMREKSPTPGTNKTLVRNRGINRSVKKR